MIQAIRAVMQTSAPRPVVTAPDPATGDDDTQVALVADTQLIQQPDFTVVQQTDGGANADLGSSERRAIATQGVYAANAVGSISANIGNPSLPVTSGRGNASYATGFDRTPSFADHARTVGITGPAAAYAATRASR